MIMIPGVGPYITKDWRSEGEDQEHDDLLAIKQQQGGG